MRSQHSSQNSPARASPKPRSTNSQAPRSHRAHSTFSHCSPDDRRRPRGAPPTSGRPPGTSKPTITSITFGGSAANPSFVIHGTNLGKAPTPNPSTHPSGLNGCPDVAGDTGYDYGTSLYLAVPAKNWAGGRYRPNLNETDCIDLVVTKFTRGEVAFLFGPFYTTYHAKFSLNNGDEVQAAVNGAAKNVHVKYGATVTS